MTTPTFFARVWPLRLAGTLAALAGVASWWTGYWTGLTAALTGLVLAWLLFRWGDRRRRMDRRARGLPVRSVAMAVIVGILLVCVTIVRFRGAAAALGLSGFALAWGGSLEGDRADDPPP